MPPKKGAASASKAPAKRHARSAENAQAAKRAKQTPVTPGPPLNAKPTQRLRIYVFGGNSGGELGIGSQSSDSVYKPIRNGKLDDASIVQVANGGMHGVALTSDNSILTWGVNDHGALGRDTSWEGGMVDLKDDAGDNDSNSEGDLNPREGNPEEVDTTNIPAGTIFTQIAAGDNASFAVTETGLLYGWGTFRSDEGDLAFSPTVKVQQNPSLVPGLKGVKKVACGRNHVLALASDGCVYSWGIGNHNQLGRRFSHRVVDWKKEGLVPRKVPGLKDIVDIGTGSDHSFAVGREDEVWSWGLNNKGQAGIVGNMGEDEAVVALPTLVEMQTKGKITQITGSNFHSIAVTDVGECLTWGRLDAYATGHSLEGLPEENILRDSRGRPTILKVPTVLPGLNTTYVASGSEHSLAITREGRAFAWGFNNDGQTGQKEEIDETKIATLLNTLAVRDKKLVWAGAGGQYSMVGELHPGDDI